MTRREDLDWRVPQEEWEAFVEYVHDDGREWRRYVASEAEKAMEEYIDRDDHAALEERVDTLVQAAGRTPDAFSQKKRAVGQEEPDDSRITRVQYRVDSDLKATFASFAKEHTDDRLGMAFAKALRAYRQSGRADRLQRKLDRIQDTATDLLAAAAGDGDMGAVEKRTLAICNRLGDQFTTDDLQDAIQNVAGHSDSTIRQYQDRVLERLDVDPHPNNPDLYVPEARARELGVDPDAPAIDRKEYADLTRQEKVHGLRVRLAQRTLSNDGKRQVDTATVRQDIFDGRPTPGHASELINAAADADGFDTSRRNGTTRLRVDLRDVTDQAVVEAVKAAADDSDQSQSDWIDMEPTEGSSHGTSPRGVDSEQPEDAAADDRDQPINRSQWDTSVTERVPSHWRDSLI